jgi:molybdate transport system ATP-binding protein
VLSVEGAELLVLADGLAPGDAVRVRIAASDISIARMRQKDGSILNALDAKVVAIEPLGMAEASVLLDIGQTAPAQLRARITQRSLNALALKTSERVVAQIKGVSLAANR